METNTLNKVIAYEIVDHGPNAESYFPGCGVDFSSYDDVYTGIGDTAGEALEVALEQAEWSGDCDFTPDQTAEIESDWLQSDWAKQDLGVDAEDNTEWHYYVSIRVKLA